MHQQIVPPSMDQYAVQPQMGPLVICPVQFVYDTQIVLPQTAVPEEIQQQPMLLNVQNPPPWHQNRQQNLIYVQQMPNQILPYVQQNMVQNHLFTPQFNYQMPQPLISQDNMVIHEIPQVVQPKTENNVESAPTTQKMPILTQLLNQKPLEIQPEKPVMLSQHVQTDFPLKTSKNSSITIQQNVAINSIKQNEAAKDMPLLDAAKIKIDATNLQNNEKVKIDNDTLSQVNNNPGGINTKDYKPVLRPIVTPTGVKSNINNIPIKLRALDPTQVISIPNYGTITNYTVLNEDKDARIPTEMQNIQNINTDNIITAKLNEKNEITFIQSAPKYCRDNPVNKVPSSLTKSFSIGTNTGSNETRKLSIETPALVSNETQTASKFIAKSLPRVVTNDNPILIKNDTRKTIKNETITRENVTNNPRKTLSDEKPKILTVETVKTTDTIKVKIDAPKTMSIDTPKKPNDTIKPVPIQPETMKSIEVKKMKQKVVKNTATETDQVKAQKTKKVEAKSKTINDIKKRIAIKNAANERFRKNDVYILTHVLDGHVIQESNVAFPIYAPAKENYSYEPFHEIARRRRTEDRPFPLKNLQIDDNAKTMEEPIEVSLVPNRPLTIDVPNDIIVSNDTLATVTNNTREVLTVTNKTNENSTDPNKDTASNDKATVKIDSIEVETTPKDSREVPVVPIKRTNTTKIAKDSKIAANRAKIPIVSIERLVGTINPHEVAAGPVDQSEVAANLTVDSVNSSNGIEPNRSSGNVKKSDKNNAKRDENPFSKLLKLTIEKWDMDALFSYLVKNNWQDTAEKLKDQEIDGEALLLANKDQLITIGVDEKHAEVINDYIAHCNSEGVGTD